MKRLPWKYSAGLIDGEGCIDVQITRLKGREEFYVRPRVRVAMAALAEDLIRALKNSYGGHVCPRKGAGNHSDSLSWELSGYSPACKFLRNVTQHLILKKEQARFCLWLERNLKGRHVSAEARDAVREELKLMKRDPHRLSEKAQERLLAMLQSE